MKSHFIWFWPEEIEKADFKFFMYLSIESFLKTNPDKQVIFHTNRHIDSPLFDLVKDRIEVRYTQAPTEIYGNKIAHVTHASDVYRLKLLIEEGGIYTDFDTVTIKSFDPVLPINGELVYSSCNYPKELFSNGVIASGPQNPFLIEWLNGYRDYKKKWGHNSIEVSTMLLETDLGKNHTRMVDPEYFYPIKWTTAKSSQLKFNQKKWDSLMESKTISYHLYNHQTRDAIESVTLENYQELTKESTVAALADYILTYESI
jgi:hypothetical protein